MKAQRRLGLALSWPRITSVFVTDVAVLILASHFPGAPQKVAWWVGVAVAAVVTIAMVSPTAGSRSPQRSQPWPGGRGICWPASAGLVHRPGGDTEPGMHARDRSPAPLRPRRGRGARVPGPAGRGDRRGRAGGRTIGAASAPGGVVGNFAGGGGGRGAAPVRCAP